MCGDRMWFNGLKYIKTSVFFVKFHTIASVLRKENILSQDFFFFKLSKE
jgi:hypothetical protein